jgi:hypothetical protein
VLALLAWGIWFGCGALAGWKGLDKKYLNEHYPKFSDTFSKRGYIFAMWFLCIILGGVSLLSVIIEDVINLFKKEKK